MGNPAAPVSVHPGRRYWSGGLAAFVITVLAGYASAWPGLVRDGVSGGALILLVSLGVVYTLMGTVGGDWFIHRSAPALRPLYFLAELLLAGAILYLSHANGFISIIVFPLVTQARQMLPLRSAILMYALIGLTVSAVVYAVAGLEPAISSLPVVVAGLVFVAVFTEVALSERAARGEVERLAAELRAANQKLREYAEQVEELATAKERNRVAREIHDSLGHYLTVINVQLEAAKVLAASDPERARTALRKAQSLTQEGLADVRRSVAALRATPTGSRPLPEAVAELVEESRAAGIVTQLAVRGQPRALAPQAELTLYRAAQEALTNVRKHARASRADLSLDYEAGDRVRLVVQDNGVGAAEPNGGFGLLGLRERVQLVGGSVALRSAPGEGFRLEVETPG